MQAGVGLCSVVCPSQDALRGSQEGDERHRGPLGMPKLEGARGESVTGAGGDRGEESEG